MYIISFNHPMLLGICSKKWVIRGNEWLCPFVADSQAQTSKSKNKEIFHEVLHPKKKKKKKHIIKTLKEFIYKHTTDSKNVQSIRKKKGIIIILPKGTILPPLMTGINVTIYYLPLDIYKYYSFGN
jgi:hypothetical protein